MLPWILRQPPSVVAPLPTSDSTLSLTLEQAILVALRLKPNLLAAGARIEGNMSRFSIGEVKP